jgi:uncharacterized protein (DUF433 family)
VYGVKFTRITIDPEQMGGVPCLRGLRIPVATILAMLAEGMTEQEILAAYPDLEPEDIKEALKFAAEAVQERQLAFGDSAVKEMMPLVRKGRRVAG